MTKGKDERLGKGLGALLGEYLDAEVSVDAAEILTVRVDEIRPNPYQPRKEFQPDELKELAMADEKVIKFTEGKTVRKVIVVPGKLINIVAN